MRINEFASPGAGGVRVGQTYVVTKQSHDKNARSLRTTLISMRINLENFASG